MFRGIGYPKCETSRRGSRLHDDCGIDLIHVPFNVQIKAGIQRGMNPIKVLKNMEDKVRETFPEEHPVHNYPSMIIWRKPPGRGKKREKFHDLVIMTYEDFKQIILNNSKKLKDDSSSQY